MDIQVLLGTSNKRKPVPEKIEAATAYPFLKLPVAWLYVDSVAKILRPETNRSSSSIPWLHACYWSITG